MVEDSRGGRTSGARNERLERLVAESRRQQDERLKSYREQSLRIHPWVCARCGREFTRANLHELTVHHKDHNHDNNPPDGSNWENLCIYCHEQEHVKLSQALGGTSAGPGTGQPRATHNPFADLKKLLDGDA